MPASVRGQGGLMASPQRDAGVAEGHKARGQRAVGDVLLREAAGHQLGDRVVDPPVLLGGRPHGGPLVAHAVAAGTVVDRGEGRGVDLAAVGDRACPPADRWLAQEPPERRRVGLVLAVDRRPEILGRWVVLRPGHAVVAVRDRPQAQSVGRPAGHRPRAPDAQPGRGACRRLVLVGEGVGDDVVDLARAIDDGSRAPVAAPGGGEGLAARVRAPGCIPQDRGSARHRRDLRGGTTAIKTRCPSITRDSTETRPDAARARSLRRRARCFAWAARKWSWLSSRHRLCLAFALSRHGRHQPSAAPQSGHRPALRRRSR